MRSERAPARVAAGPEEGAAGTGEARRRSARILVVDDDGPLRQQIAWALRGEYEVFEAADREGALAAVARQSPDLLLLDLHLPPGRGTGQGMEVLRAVRNGHLDALVIVMTGDAAKEPALRAIESGAYDYFRKPIDVGELKLIIGRALEKQRIERENRQLRRELMQQESFENLIGRSAGMRRVFDSIRRAASSAATVIIRGESGTGKELVARAIHTTSRRPGPFVAVQCSALPEPLIESELFGHERGAFTGAVSAHAGRFEMADGGTLFLDEIGTLSPAIQAKLLRVLEQRQFERLGGKQTLRVDVRLITATNENLEAMIGEGRFREDLYYRVNVFPIYLPPLRERREDIPLLAGHFLDLFSRGRDGAAKRIDAEAMDRIVNSEWRGNVRELENVLQAVVLRTDAEVITSADLPARLREISAAEAGRLAPDPGRSIDLPTAVERFELQMLQMALTRAGGVKTEAARLLGIDKNRMMYLCRKHGL